MPLVRLYEDIGTEFCQLLVLYKRVTRMPLVRLYEDIGTEFCQLLVLYKRVTRIPRARLYKEIDVAGVGLSWCKF
jgi:hypothetical protein